MKPCKPLVNGLNHQNSALRLTHVNRNAPGLEEEDVK